MIRKSLLALSLGIALAAPVAARDLSATDREGVDAVVLQLDTAIQKMDMASTFNAMPPKVLQQLADNAGVSVKVLIKATGKQVATLMEKVEIKETSMDTSRAKFGQLSTGMQYGLIPTRVLMRIDDQKILSKSETLALKDDGRWYLIRIEGEQHIQLLQTVYPAFSEVKFKPGTMKKVND